MLAAIDLRPGAHYSARHKREVCPFVERQAFVRTPQQPFPRASAE
jgi:hypothetical protein